MRIKTEDERVMRLSGVPGGVPWMVFATVFGVVLTSAFGYVAYLQSGPSGAWVPMVVCLIGAAFGQVFTWIGIATLAVARESLELDRAGGVGRYRSRSPIITVPKSFDFQLERVHSVSVERYTERTPVGGGGAGQRIGSSEMDVCRARLLIDRPRRAITLDETSNHRDARVRGVAERVAVFLSVPIEERDTRSDR